MSSAHNVIHPPTQATMPPAAGAPLDGVCVIVTVSVAHGISKIMGPFANPASARAYAQENIEDKDRYRVPLSPPEDSNGAFDPEEE